jgi:hypothetical protein
MTKVKEAERQQWSFFLSFIGLFLLYKGQRKMKREMWKGKDI